MRILLVTPYYIPAWGFGGPVKVVADLARTLQKRGHSVTVATTDVLDRQSRVKVTDDVIDGVKVQYFANPSNTAAYRWNVYAPRKFSTWLQAHISEFDIVHCHDVYTGLNVDVSRIAHRAGVPYLIQPHGALIPIRQRAKLSVIKATWLKVFSHVLRDAAYVVASTPQEQKEIQIHQRVPDDQVVVIPNGLDGQHLGRPIVDSAVRQQYGISQDDTVILYFGRIQYIKGLDISLRALAEVQGVSWKYIIIGRDDGQVNRLKNLAQTLGIAERVQFLGPKFGAELDEVLGISDIFLFNSRSESFPIAVLNACAAGLPAILSPECRLPEVETYGAGKVLSDNSPTKTARLIEQVTSDVEARKMMSLAGPKLISQVFSLDRVVDQCLAAYTQAIKRLE